MKLHASGRKWLFEAKLTQASSTRLRAAASKNFLESVNMAKTIHPSYQIHAGVQIKHKGVHLPKGWGTYRGHQGVVRGDQAEATGRDLVDTLFRQVLGRVCGSQAMLE